MDFGGFFPSISINLPDIASIWNNPEKDVQLSEQGHIELFELTCLWIYVHRQMGKTFTADVVERHEGLFFEGYFVIPGVCPF